jgi:outer membrane protein assembly factor BamB
MTAVFLASFILAAAPAPKDAALSTEDWPQWRGPNRDGKSGVKGVVFPKDGPKLAWKNEHIGMGYGQPIVVGDKLYVLGGAENKPGSPESLRCLSLADGNELWKLDLGTSAGDYQAPGYGCGPRSAPTYADGHLYVLGATGDLVCCTDAGKKVWSKNLKKDFGGQIPTWGYAESPLVDDGHVVVTPGKGTGMIALDAKTGKTVWECKEFKDGAGYSSIVPMMLGETKLYIQQTMVAGLAVKAKDGKLAFKGDSMGRKTAVIPTPVVSGEYAFFTAGYGAGCECFKFSLEGSEVKAATLFTENKSMENHHGNVIGIDDHVYGYSGGKGWTCMTFKTGNPKVLWSNKTLLKGCISFADELLFCYQESNGDLAAIKASPEEWNEVGRLKLPGKCPTRPGGDRVWSHPVIAQGKLFLRDFEYLYAFDVKPKS